MRRFEPFIAASLTCALVACNGSSEPVQVRSVVLLTIDTLRADRLAPSTMPALSAFADGGLRFAHARTPAPLTLPAHTSLMTGRVPPAHGVRENGATADSHTIAAQLRARGFRTGAFVSAFVLDRRFGLASGFEHYDDRVMRDPDAALRLEAERAGTETVAAALAWLSTLDARRERFFLWVHLFEPHAPYAPTADCGAPGADSAAYDRDVACADMVTARLIKGVRDLAGEDVAWVVAGDHGESLGEHGESTHGMLVYDSTLRVPLILRGPGVRAGTVDAPVSLVDVAPTILAWAGAGALPEHDGVDLRGSLTGDRDVYSESVYPRRAGWHSLSALSGARWKAIRSSGTEFYDVQADPAERENVAAARPQAAAAMAEAAARINTSGASGAARETDVSPEARERLRALGYVSGSAAAGDTDRAANPAKEIGQWVRFEHALSLLHAGHAREALPTLASLSAAYPDGQVFQSTYARALEETGDPRRALAVHRAIVERWPGDAMLFHDLASAARLAGDAAEAARAEQAALALEPGNAAALNGAGLAHADAGRAEDAARAFEAAAAADPGSASYLTNLGNARRELGNLAGAEDAYRRALAVAPQYVEGLNGLGVVMVQTGRAREAVPVFERAVSTDAHHIESRLNLAIAYQESGRIDEARRAYREVITRAPARSREREAATALLSALK